MKAKLFNTFMVLTLIILGFVIFKILLRHYWVLFFSWLLIPFVQLWLNDKYIRGNLTQEINDVFKKVLIITAIILSLFSSHFHDPVRESLARKYVNGYHKVKSYDCEVPENPDGSQSGEPPEFCFNEDLQYVEWYWKGVLSLDSFAHFILIFLVPGLTVLAGDSYFRKKISNHDV